MIFAIQNWPWKSYFGTFWYLPTTYTNSQNSIIFFGYVEFLPKNILILYPSLENSTTSIAIVVIRLEICILSRKLIRNDWFVFQLIFEGNQHKIEPWIRSKRFMIFPWKQLWIPIYIYMNVNFEMGESKRWS